ncbi:ATP-dependent DNA helicase [Trichonephila clavipes]|nr:ATP-dependent DNA helicase [Trichonephila clavipes]
MGNILEATILIVKFQGEVVLLPRIPMIPSDSPLPFKRLQFPIRLAFATTINKSQGKQKIELAKLQLAKLEKEVALQTAKKELSLNPAAKVEEKQFETLYKETATHIGIREAEDWFRPINLAKECDIYISSRSGSHKKFIIWIYPRPL